MPAGDYQMMTILVVDNPRPEVPQGPTVQAALEAYPFRLYITRKGPLYLQRKVQNFKDVKLIRHLSKYCDRKYKNVMSSNGQFCVTM